MKSLVLIPITAMNQFPLLLTLLALPLTLVADEAGADGLVLTPLAESVLEPGLPLRARLNIENHGSTGKSAAIRWKLQANPTFAEDPVAHTTVGPTVETGTAQVQVPARDAAEIVLSGSAALAPGGYLLGLEQDLDGRKEVRWSQLFVRPSDQVDTRRTRRFGINGASIALAEEMRRCGFGWIRFENCKWMFFSPARDQYAFDGSVGPWRVPHDSCFSDYQKLGMNVLPYVFMVPDWAHGAPSKDTKNTCNYPPKDNADYGEAIFQLVARMGSASVAPALLKTADKKSGLKLINAVELWNEPNLNDPDWGPYVGTMAQYFDTLRAGVEGSRRADPSLPVSGAGMAGIDLAVIDQFAEHRYPDGKTPLDLIDIVNVHFYSGREEPEICGWDPNVARDVSIRSGLLYPDQLEDLVAWRDQLKPKAELWLSEIGNDVGGPIGGSERAQATKVPRAVMIALAAGVDKVMIYRESGSDPAMHAGAGLLRNDGSLRPVWFSVATMIRQLQGFNGRALRLPSDDPTVWVYLWEDGPRKLITAWRHAGTSPLGVDLGKTTVCDGFGRSTTVADTTSLILSELPTYITITAPSPALHKLVAAGRARAQAHSAERTRLAKLPVSLIDFGPPGQPLGMLKGHGLPRRCTPVNKDTLWNDQLGYGWEKPAMSDEDARWISDPLERDACRIDPTHVFRLRLAPGKHHLRISAEPFGQTGVITVKSAAGEQKLSITKEKHVGEIDIQGGPDPIEIRVSEYFFIRWIESVGSNPASRATSATPMRAAENRRFLVRAD